MVRRYCPRHSSTTLLIGNVHSLPLLKSGYIGQERAPSRRNSRTEMPRLSPTTLAGGRVNALSLPADEALGGWSYQCYW
jgi:hypothetical protein